MSFLESELILEKTKNSDVKQWNRLSINNLVCYVVLFLKCRIAIFCKKSQFLKFWNNAKARATRALAYIFALYKTEKKLNSQSAQEGGTSAFYVCFSNSSLNFQDRDSNQFPHS